MRRAWRKKRGEEAFQSRSEIWVEELKQRRKIKKEQRWGAEIYVCRGLE